MIDQSASRTARAAPRLRRSRFPVPPAAARALVLAAVFVCAACGLVYELELVALGSYLVGDSVTQASIVLSVMVFAMGVGSLLAKRLSCAPAIGFAAVEIALALVGGLSVMALYASFAWFGQSRPAMAVFAFVIGVLIGAEIPLLMTLIQRIRRQDAGGAVADLFAADYVGALVGGLAFPFLLLPCYGQLTGALVTGAVNAVAGGAVVLWLFRGDITPRARARLLAADVVVLAVLAGAAWAAGPFERAARQAVYGGDVRLAEQTGVQEVVLTAAPLQLFLDGRLRVRGRDEYRYHEALVHPAMTGRHRRVLILGGGDGLALREVLRHRGVGSVTLVDPDARLVALARDDPALARLNRHAYRDPRVRVAAADVFDWLRRERPPRPPGGYDVVLADLPDPGISRSAKLYSQEFYGLVRRALAPGGRLAVHAGAPGADRRGFWTVDASVRAAGLRTADYWIGTGRGDEDWGFVLAAPLRAPALRLAADAPRPRSLSPAALASAARRAARAPLRDLPPSTLMHPRSG
ncbi:MULTISPECIES: polyamine aminopropyltransferase [unclassified Streptomyces]|uniref:polyamine aminopropyltransferase n=1 Tax=unclassified Streptomyces TaxID=2593676 RepID=UPI000382EE02|nr:MULTISPECIES: polyamine aminopropyltransferase [unclassified Streptomyces]MYX35958.1 polyamine aminopropyltransferase [Streptomyces sp. SID8377]